MTERPMVYLFDRETGEFLGSKTARMSPLEPDVPLVPRAATLVAPPEHVPGYARCWRDGQWKYVEDHRDQTVYSTEDGREIVIKELGPLPENVTTQPRPSERHVWQDGQWGEVPPSIQELLNYLGRKRVEVEEGGIVLNGIPIATDREHSQVKITAAYVKAVNDPNFEIQNWKVAPGVFIPVIDAETIIAMGDAVTAHIQACFNKEAELAAKITADPPQITTYQEIDEADWPSNG